MNKVYILTDGGHDYSDALRFGEIQFCLSTPPRRNDLSQMFRELKVALADAQPNDMILINGLSSLCCVATAILADRYGEVHYLLFVDGKYKKQDLILTNDLLEN